MSGPESQFSGFQKVGVTIGLRAPHYVHILNEKPKFRWFEAVSENYIGIDEKSGGRPLKILKQIRKDYEVVLHGVSMSIGSVDPLDLKYLNRLKSLFEQIEPAWVSDHLCWTGVEGENLHDLLPLPYTDEALSHLSAKIQAVQEYLKRPMLFENVSSYVEFSHSHMSEWEFLNEVSKRTGCGILLDINNIYVNSRNHSFDPRHFVDGIDSERVGQLHLAGHSDLGTHLIDTHDHPVCEEVWELFGYACRKFGAIPTLLEWDANIPDFSVLESECAHANAVQTREARHHAKADALFA
jgi:uncharacterized protein (UPF0276 family)